MQEALLDRIQYLSHIDRKKEVILAAELLEEYLKNNPQDTQAWLRLFMISMSDRLDLENEMRAIEACKSILAYDPYNVRALLALSYVYYYYPHNKYEDAIVEKLFTVQTDNQEDMSLIELARARYYEDKNDAVLQEKALVKSIAYSEKFVRNYEMLGTLYARYGRFDEAIPLLKKALANIKFVVSGIGQYKADRSDIESLLDEFFRGIHVSIIFQEDIQEKLDYCIDQLSEIN
jgi:lipopolysaccharide biosynthesis regulator YciM